MSAAIHRSGSRHALIGRDRDVDRALAFLDQALIDGGAVVVTGEPGVGKTALLDVIAEAGTARGARLVRSSGREFEARVGCAVVDRLLARLRGATAELPSGYRTGLQTALGTHDAPPAQRLMLGNAVLDILRRASAGGPVLIVVDDLQWVDQASVEVVAFAARRLAGTRAAIVGAGRAEAAARFATAGLPEMTLHPVDAEAAASLVATRHPDLAPAVRSRVVDEARGNPLALIELPAAMTGRHRAGTDPLPPTLPITERLATTFAPGIEALPAPSRTVLLLAALEGSGELRVLEAAAGGGLDQLAAAEHSGLVSIGADTGVVTFRHPLVRAAVVGRASESARRRAHRALADALVSAPARRVGHLSEAALHADEQVAALLEQVGRHCLHDGDAAAAVRGLTRAAELSPEPADRARRLIDAAYLAATMTGEPAAAARLLHAATATEPQAAQSLRAAITASRLLLDAEGDVVAAHRLLAAAILRHRTRDSSADEPLVDALFTLCLICWFGGRADLWAPVDEAMSCIAPAPPSLRAMAFADPVRRAPQPTGQFANPMPDVGDDLDPSTVTRFGFASVYHDRVGARRDSLWRVIRDGRAGRAGAASTSAVLTLCLDDWLTGRWDEALALADEGIALGRAQGTRLPTQILDGYVRPLILAARDDRQGAGAAADELAGWAASHEVGTAAAFARHVYTVSAISRGDFEAAYRHACSISPPGHLERCHPHALWVLLDLVESAMRTGRHAEAEAHVAAMRTVGLAAISPRLAMVSDGCAALVSEGPRAEELFERALAVPGADRWPFEFARLQLAYGEHLRQARSGEKGADEARHHLLMAQNVFEQLGALPWSRRTTDQVRATGLSTARTDLGPRSVRLTDQEREIAHLAASGLTNKQIAERLYLSHRTIGAHLYKIYPKLGVSSRAALRDALATLQ